MNKLCFIFNTPSLYRKLIYTRMDVEFNCDWYFGDWNANVKSFDTKCLKNPVHTLHVNNPGGSRYATDGLVKLLRDNRYETYLMIGDAHDLSTWRMLLWKNIFCRKKRIFFWTHGWYGKESRIERIAKKMFYRMVDGVFLYGNHAKKLMIKEGFTPEKLYVIHNSLDYSQQLTLRSKCESSSIYKVFFGNSNPVLIMIGRLNIRKHLDMLFNAVAKLKKEGLLYNIVLIGDGEDKGKLVELSKELGITEQVWFYGACFDEATNANLIYNADLCVVPGDVGLTAIHSMMFGVPVITHNHFPYHGPEFEAIHTGETGGFYEYRNVESLVSTIKEWFAHNSDRDNVRKACYHEIDTQWTPDFQIAVLKQHLI